jgi:hypothetical protein
MAIFPEKSQSVFSQDLVIYVKDIIVFPMDTLEQITTTDNSDEGMLE